MSLLSVEHGEGGASRGDALGCGVAVGARPGRWSAACSSTLTGWQGLFWIDAVIAVLCVR